MLDKIKESLRIKHNSLDRDLTDCINAAIIDLKTSGIIASSDTEDALIIQSIKLYCKWHYDYMNQADRYLESYESLKTAMALSGDYENER